MLLRLADAIEENAEELAELEATNAGKPLAAFKDDEIPFMVDNLRFRGRRPVPGGASPRASTSRATPR